MPRNKWTLRDERQYLAIVKSCRKRRRYGLKRCKSIAAATVNKFRASHKKTRARGLGECDCERK